VDLSVVIPVYNEEESLPVLLDALRPVLEGTGRSFEVILVDDGSADRSWPLIVERSRRDPWVRGLRFERNRGQTAAFDAGFQAARGDLVVTLDADLQNDPADIPRLLEALDGNDAVCGIRARRQDTLVKRFSSRFARFVRSLVTGDDIVDIGCSLKLFRREPLLRLKLFTGLHRFFPVLLAMEGAKIVQVPVNHRPRKFGESKYPTWKRIVRPLMDLFAVKWMMRRRLDYRVKETTGC